MVVAINAKAKTDGYRTGTSSHGLAQKITPKVLMGKNRCIGKPDFSGVNLENIIADVAVEGRRVGKALRVLTGRLIQAQEEERRRLARELHDGLNQELAMLTVELGMLAQQPAENVSEIRIRLSELRDRTERLSNDLRRMTHRLHPAILEHLGLIPALSSYCAEFSQSEGIRVWFRVASEVAPMPLETAVCLYRITQEALRNVAKHSSAKEALVEITQNRKETHLSIVDKGVGFDFRIPASGKCLGLISMRERAQLLSGSVTIKTAPGEGTRVDIRVPSVLGRRKGKSPRRDHAKTEITVG